MTTNKVLSITCVVALTSILGLSYYWNDFLGSLNVNVSMDRELALSEGQEATKDFDILGDDLDQAAAYSFSSSLRDYVELKQGGREKFQSIIDSDIFSPYNWIVRTFKEGQVAEASFMFKPDGSSNGYRVKIPDDHDSDSLSEEDALRVISLKINDHWSGDFADYSLIESSFEEMPNGRVDHSFVFEHKLQDIGDAKYRLDVDVSGVLVSSVLPSAFIPESFNREFANIRSDNDTIAMFANFAFLGIYILVIGLGAIIIFYRTGWLRWKSSMLVAGFIAITSTLVSLNFYPTMWMAYDTATSKSQFMLEGLLGMLANGVVNFLLFGLTFVIAESLTRRAFPEHIQLWKTWTMNVANSKRVLNDTIFAYLIVPIKLAIVGGFYILMEKYFGFWSPASSMADPNYLASVFPWYTGIAISLQAGFWEEMLFRAVPIAAGVLIGKRYNMRFTGLVIAMILQALIFGAGHANYPAQPSYARVVELFLPSIIVYGMLYLKLGVIFGAITHYLYDVVLFSLPIWYSSGYVVDKFMTVLGGAIPLLVILYFRVRANKWSEIDDTSLNKGFEPTPPEVQKAKEKSTAIVQDGSPLNKKVLLGSIIFIVVAMASFQLSDSDVSIESPSVNREQAIDIAEDFLVTKNITLAEGYEGNAMVVTDYPASDFIWEELGSDTFNNLLGSYVLAPRWKVRFAKFDGEVETRAREVIVSVDFKGNPIRFYNKFPENEVGASLSQSDAKVIADQALSEHFNLSTSMVSLVSAVESQKPERLDWIFTYAEDREIDYEGSQFQNIITVSGDQLAGFSQSVYIPEEWERMKRDREGFSGILAMLFTIPGGLFIGGLLLIRSFKMLMDRKVNLRKGALFGGILLISGLVKFFNDSSFLMTLPTDQPIANLMSITYISTIAGILIIGLSQALFFGSLGTMLKSTINRSSLSDSIIGGLVAALLVATSAMLIGTFQLDLNPNFPRITLGGSYYPILDTFNIYGGLFISVAFSLFFAKTLFEWTDGYSNNIKSNVYGILLVMFVYGGEIGMQYNIGLSLVLITLYSIVLFMIYKFIIKNNYMLIPFMVLFARVINIFAGNELGAFNSYPNETILLGVSYAIGLVVWTQLTKFFFDTDQ